MPTEKKSSRDKYILYSMLYFQQKKKRWWELLMCVEVRIFHSSFIVNTDILTYRCKTCYSSLIFIAWSRLLDICFSPSHLPGEKSKFSSSRFSKPVRSSFEPGKKANSQPERFSQPIRSSFEPGEKAKSRPERFSQPVRSSFEPGEKAKSRPDRFSKPVRSSFELGEKSKFSTWKVFLTCQVFLWTWRKSKF